MPTDSTEPFFLVGAVRSGTTVLRLALGHHPQICRCDEFEYVAPALTGQANWPDVASYVRTLPHHRDFRESGYRANASLSFPALAHSFFAQRRALDGRPLVGATVHNDFDQLTRLWPEAKFIHLERDPRDVARSCVQMGWAGNAWRAVEIWERADASWRALRARVPAENQLEVKFEDFVRDAESELARITRFLGVAYDPAMLDIERDTTYRRPDPRAARSWRDDASEREVREMEARLGARLADAGYAPSGLPALQLTPLQRLALTLDSRVGRMRFSQRRYGVPLWAASVASRWLPLPGLRDSVRLARDRIDQRHLK
jgi:hypothetical protein